MKKTFLSALVVIALTAQLTGCNGNAPAEQPNESSSVVSDVSEPQNSTSSSETESSSKPQSSTASTTLSTSETSKPQSSSFTTTSSTSETSTAQNSTTTATSSVPEVSEPQSGTVSTTSSEPDKPPVTYSPETDFGCAFMNDSVEIRTYVGNGGDVIIPETISGDPVVMVSGRVTNREGFVGAFKNNTAVTSITIPDTVTGFGGVEGCTNLESINVGEGNPYLASVDGMLCRKTDNGLMLVLCPEGKKGKAVIPDSVTEIAEGAFNGCGGITEIVVGNGVTKVNKDILGGCENLKHLTLGNGIKRVGEWRGIAPENYFSDCNSLESVTFGAETTEILGEAFNGCTSLKKVVFGKGLTTIGEYAFAGCSSLSDIDIPKSVTRIYVNAFQGTAWIENKRKESPFIIINGILIDGTACSGNITIPAGVAEIGENAFSGCKNITSVTVPSGVTHINSGAFFECEKLKTVNLPDSITYISEEGPLLPGAFSLCNDIKVTYKGKTYTQSNMNDLYNLF